MRWWLGDLAALGLPPTRAPDVEPGRAPGLWFGGVRDRGGAGAGGRDPGASFFFFSDPLVAPARATPPTRLPLARALTPVRPSPLLSLSTPVADNVKYAPTHEWAKLEGDTVTVGISDHAQVREWEKEREK